MLAQQHVRRPGGKAHHRHSRAESLDRELNRGAELRHEALHVRGHVGARRVDEVELLEGLHSQRISGGDRLSLHQRGAASVPWRVGMRATLHYVWCRPYWERLM